MARRTKPNRYSQYRLKNTGFALMPVILTVLITGALIGVGLTVIGPRLQKENYNETMVAMDAAVQAIISWSSTNNRLPDGSTFPTIVGNINDAWQNPFIYVYDNSLTSPSTGGLCGRRTTSVTSGSTSNIAFLIISGGDDYAVNSSPNVSGQYSGNVTASINDVIKSVTLEELKNSAGCYKSEGRRFQIINRELPGACVGQTYTATLYAEWGVPFSVGGNYKWCIKGPLPAGLTVTPNTPGCSLTSDCDSLATEAGSQWAQANSLQLNGTPTTAGTYPIIVLIRDNNDNNTGTSNDNCVQKTFSINVASCGGSPPPVKSYDFNEGAGPIVKDQQGGNDGTLEGDVDWVSDTPEGSGSALSFDGDADYVKVPHSESLRITGELTLTAWAKETVVHSYAKIISRRSNNYFYFLGVDSGHPYGGVGDGSAYSVTGKSLLMSLNQWNHLAFVYNDADDKMFIHFDGTEKNTNVSFNVPQKKKKDKVKISIGADSGGKSDFFNGVIDDVRIFNKALTASEIRDIYSGSSSEPHVALYPFNNNANDASGNGHDGSVKGASFVDDRAGNNNAALSFDGSDYVLVKDHADFWFTDQFTLMAWIKEASPVQSAKIFSFRSKAYFYFIGVDNSHPYGGIGGGPSNTVTLKSIDMPSDRWHLIAFVYNSSTGKMHIYYDGIVDETNVTISLPDMDNVDLTIGGDAEGSSNFFEGLIDEVGIYDVELSVDEIRGTYK
jgi:hypothetical protein